MRYHLLVLLFLLSGNGNLSAQVSIVLDNSDSAIEDTSSNAYNQLFNLESEDYLPDELKKQQELEVRHQAKQRKAEKLQTNSYLFFLFILMFLLLGFIIVSDNEYVQELFRGLLDFNYINLMGREGKLGLGLSNILLDLIFVFALSTFLYVFQLSQKVFNLYEIWLAVTSIYLIYIIFVIISSNVFYGIEGIRPILWNIVIYNRIIGIILLPVMFIVSYINFGVNYILILVGGLILLFILVRAIRALFQMKTYSRYGGFYNFLYLCTIEVAPVVVLLKLIALYL